MAFSSLEEVLRVDEYHQKIGSKREYDVNLRTFIEALYMGVESFNFNSPQIQSSDGAKKYVHRLRYNGMTLILVSDKGLAFVEPFDEILLYPFYN